MLNNEYLNNVLKYGSNFQSFLGTYEDYEYYKYSNSILSYVSFNKHIVSVGGPVGPKDDFFDSLLELKSEMDKQNKKVLMLALTKQETEIALKAGFSKCLLGHDAIFELNKYNFELKNFPAAKRMKQAGAIVTQVSPKDLNAIERSKYDIILEYWLTTRKSPPLQFTNKVELWTNKSSRKYFKLEMDGKLLTILACVPIPCENAWYLIDLLRSEHAINGSAELILFESMQILKSEGVSWVCLGAAPLEGIEREPVSDHPKLYPFLKSIVTKMESFYNFQSLYEFKRKMRPTKWEPVYLCYYPNTLQFKDAIALLNVFQPQGMIHSFFGWIQRTIHNFPSAKWIRNLTKDDIIISDPPETLLELVQKSSISVVFFVLFFCMYLYVSILDEHTYKYIIDNFVGYHFQQPFRNLFVPLFTSIGLHSSLTHLITNIFLLSIFSPIVETIFGKRFLLFTFIGASILAQLLTSFTFSLFPEFPIHTIDVGASLGIFALAGALSYIIKRGKYLFLTMTIFTVASVYFEKDFTELNHFFALLLGLLFSIYKFQIPKMNKIWIK